MCTVSGRCFDRWLSPAEENGAEIVSMLEISCTGERKHVQDPLKRLVFVALIKKSNY